jgi:hypothetical protein
MHTLHSCPLTYEIIFLQREKGRLSGVRRVCMLVAHIQYAPAINPLWFAVH